MFKITQNTLRDFTLAEVLLMAAMNQLEAKRKAFGNEVSRHHRCRTVRKRLSLPSQSRSRNFRRVTRDQGMSWS
jgi:hypothetical protein